jgi:hypothetical protein
MPTFDDDILERLQRGDPRCRYLRTKALHVYGRHTPDAVATSASSHYHCLRTQFVTGPDARLCTPEDCQPGRSCYEADG